MNAAIAHLGCPPRDADDVIADAHAGANSLLEQVREWRTTPPTTGRIEACDRTLAGLQRILGELRIAQQARAA